MNDEIYMPKINRIDYHRKPHIEKEYQNHLRKLKNKNIKIDDYILETVLKDNLFMSLQKAVIVFFILVLIILLILTYIL